MEYGYHVGSSPTFGKLSVDVLCPAAIPGAPQLASAAAAAAAPRGAPRDVRPVYEQVTRLFVLRVLFAESSACAQTLR